MNPPTAQPPRGEGAADLLVGPEPAAPAVLAVEALPAFRLRVSFADGEARVFDVGPLLGLGGFARLARGDAFTRVSVDEVGGGVVWEAGPDLSGDTLYYGGVPG